MQKFVMQKSILLLSAFAVALASPAYGQSKKELAAQDAMLAERITNLESRMLTGDPAAERLMQRIDALEEAQRTLTGELERVRYERDNLRTEVKALTDDVRAMQELSNRMQIHLDAVDLVASEQQNRRAPRVYDGSPNAGQYATPSYQTQQPVPYDPTPNYGTNPTIISGPPSVSQQTIGVQDSYQDLASLPASGKQKMLEGRFLEAQSDFKTYLGAIPDAADAGEVNFWLGESHYVQGQFTDAASAYIQSMKKAPNGIKAPDAMVKLAGALRELGKKAEACQTLDSFPAQYPNAAAIIRQKVRDELARTGC